MFGELPKVFDTKFLIGFFLPCSAFFAITLFIATGYELISTPTNVVKDNILVGTTILGFVIWLASVMLLATNRSIYMFLEGYGEYNPLKLLVKMEKKRFDILSRRYFDLSKKIDALRSAGVEVSAEMLGERQGLRLTLVEEFPDKREWVLPTRLGNCIRAFEIYSRDMYGIDDIAGWSRLLAVIPKDYMVLVDDAKAQTDFWINLSFVSLILVIEYLGTSLCCQELRMVWLPPVLLYASFFFLKRGRLAAIEWGDTVKAAYDVFLPDLLKKLQFPMPSSLEEERSLWSNFSKAIIYRRSAKMPSRDATGGHSTPPLGGSG